MTGIESVRSLLATSPQQLGLGTQGTAALSGRLRPEEKAFLDQAQAVARMRQAAESTAPMENVPSGLEALSATLEATPTQRAPSFQDMLAELLESVDAKRDASQVEARRLMTGESDNLHQAMITMQESSLAFTLMVEVRNKLVEGFQEVMRMQM